MFKLIIQYLKENKNVFAVVGKDHIPMLSAAIKCEWEKLNTSKNKRH